VWRRRPEDEVGVSELVPEIAGVERRPVVLGEMRAPREFLQQRQM